MKIRNGFVSNSSSMSYVVVIPEGFDAEDFIFSNLKAIKELYQKNNRPWRRKGETPAPPVPLPPNYIENLINGFKAGIKRGSMYYGEGDRNYYDIVNIITGMMNDLVIGRIEGGPDESSVTFIKERTITDKLNKFKVEGFPEEEKNKIKDVWKSENEEKARKKEAKKIQIKKVDPYEEEDWGDVDEKLRIKRFKK